MGVKERLADVWYRVKVWAHSVPPDVWIGLAIAALTLIVVYLAYRNSSKSSSSSSGLSPSNPIVGTAGSIANTPLTSQDVLSGNGSGSGLGVFDVTKLWTGVSGSGVNGNPTVGPVGRIPSTLAQIFQSATTRDESVTARMSANTNSAYVPVSPYLQSIAANVPTETAIAQSIQTTPPALVSSPPNQTETSIAKLLQAPKPQPTYAPAPVRINPYVITSTPTGRGVNVGY